jgi:hypothetical protein
MGAKTSMLVIADVDPIAILKSAPALDREACAAVLNELFPDDGFTPLPDADLSDTYPRGGDVIVGCFPGLTILAHESLIVEPSQLDRRIVDFAGGRTIFHHVMISTVDGFAYGIWDKGELRRAFAIDADNGIMEDIGNRRPFEEPFWSGAHLEEGEEPDPDYAGGVPFHPLDLAEAALLALFGYQLEGESGAGDVRPESIPLMRFARAPTRPWWKLW